MGPAGVVLQLAHPLEADVVHGALHKGFVEIARSELGHFFQGQVAYLLKGLALFGKAEGDEHAVVGLGFIEGIHLHSLLLHVDIQVDKTGAAVAEHAACNFTHGGGGEVAGTGKPPAQGHHFGLEAVNFLLYRSGDGIFGLILQGGDVRIGLPVAEVLLYKRQGFPGIEITRHADCYVVGNIVGVVVVLDVGDRRILELLLGAQNGLGAVGVVLEKTCLKGLEQLFGVGGERHVLLFVHRFKFGMEAANHVVAEAVGLHYRPVLQLVGGDVFGVNRFVLAGPGIGTAGAYHAHELVVFVGYGKLGRLIAHGVDAAVHLQPLGRVGDGAVLLEEVLDLVQHRLFGRIVAGAELLAALEHQVLEVVGETSGFVRIVLAAGAHRDESLDAGLFLVHGHIYLEPVVEGINQALHGIAFRPFAPVAGTEGYRCQKEGESEDKQESFHFLGNFSSKIRLNPKKCLTCARSFS